MSIEEDFVKSITAEWTTIIESVDIDGWTRPVDNVKTLLQLDRCHINFLLEDLSKDEKFVPIDGKTQKTYRRWSSKLIPIFEDILGDKEDTIPNSSFTEFKFRSGWGESLDYSVWRISIIFNIKGMMAKHRERKIDELLNGK
jgi:hypothetical protein